jgi:tetratricopeptide (TPR) repeat protein
MLAPSSQLDFLMISGVDDQVSELLGIATAMFNGGNLDGSKEVLTTLNVVSPANFGVLKLLGIIAATERRYGEAATLLDQAIRLNGRDALAWNVLSVCRFKGGDYPGALDSADRAIGLRGGFGEAHNNRGNALNRLGRQTAALAAFERALSILPGDAEILVNIGNVLRDLGQPAASIDHLDRAIAIDADITDAHYNRGNALQDLGRHAEAIESYGAALRVDPEHVDSHWNRSLCNLLTGDFEAGWREYEWRWRRSAAESRPRDFPCPLWLGREDLAGKTILLHCEQGLGDSIQFIRYAPAVARLGAVVIVEAFPPLVELFAQVEGISQVIPRGAAIPAADFHCPLMSLPLALSQVALGGGAFAPVPFALRAPEAMRRKWRGVVGEATALNVGVVCSGSTTHKADHRRSISARAMFAALPPGPTYHLLQKELREPDAEFLSTRDDIRFVGDSLSGFADTAGLCEAMDVVITVDTSVAHLAGALGRPTWILLPYDPDWRWGLGAEATPWYPSARLYRQAVRGDWAEPLARVGADLAALSHPAR